MEHPDEFIKLLRQIMNKDPEPLMSEEEIHIDQLVMEMVGDYLVGWKPLQEQGCSTLGRNRVIPH